MVGSGNYSAGRFEWLTVPTGQDGTDTSRQTADVFFAKACPECGWLDADSRFELLAGEPGSRECFRCGTHWDLSAEINQFFAKENIQIPPVIVETKSDNLNFFYSKKPDSNPDLFPLYIKAEQHSLKNGFDTLLSLSLSNIERFEHQVNTAMTVLKKMHSRALLADEVGLGKTIEAGLVLKELLCRGIVEKVLILVPAPLTNQWKRELKEKFNEHFNFFNKKSHSVNDNCIIVSYDLAKRHRVLQTVNWDLLILDEAHRLKGRNTQLAKFVRAIKSRYVLALSATPIQNTLIELYALADLIRPGKLGTLRGFKRTFVSPANPRKVAPGREAALKDELSDIMIRNRRDTCNIQFPKRRAGIYFIKASLAESTLYERVTRFIKEEFKKLFYQETRKKTHMLSLIVLQRELMSTPAAVQSTLLKIANRKGYPEQTRTYLMEFAEMAGAIKQPTKIKALLEILDRYKGQHFLIFTEFVRSMASIVSHVEKQGMPVFALSGSMSLSQRELVIQQFYQTPSSSLVSTEAGGTGLNLQFCHHLVNFDLPWNPTRVEQRIGRVDRIGQTHDVYVFNLVCQDTIEEHVIDILAKKLRMFEMVMGECQDVLGHLGQGRSFEQMVVDVWSKNYSPKEESKGFRILADRAEEARTAHDYGRQTREILNRLGRYA